MRVPWNLRLSSKNAGRNFLPGKKNRFVFFENQEINEKINGIKDRR